MLRWGICRQRRARRFTSLFSRSRGFAPWILVRCCSGKSTPIYVGLGCRSMMNWRLPPPLLQLVRPRDAASGWPLSPSGWMNAVQRGRHHALLGLRHIGQRISASNSTRQRCHVAAQHPADRRLQPLMGVRITSFTPRRPRRARLFRKPDQNVSASEGAQCPPTISGLPSVFTATAIIAATVPSGRPRAA